MPSILLKPTMPQPEKLLTATLKRPDIIMIRNRASINAPKNWFTTTTACPCTASAAKTTKPKKVEIQQNADNRDTTDLQTVFAELARQYNNVKFCDSRMQVFDGKRRFDVIFRDEGKERLVANEYSALWRRRRKMLHVY